MKNYCIDFSFLCFICILLNASYSEAQSLSNLDPSIGLGTFNGTVHDVQVQPDGKILLGGEFTYYKNIGAKHIIRLNADGSVDNTFSVGLGSNGYVKTIAIQPDGRILVGGYFTTFNGAIRNYITRLNANGSTDFTFNPGTGMYSNESSMTIVMDIKIQSDGKILVGGYFSRFNGSESRCIVRLNVNGTIDDTFLTGTGSNINVNSIALQTDGKIIVGGDFIKFNETSAGGIVRLNSNGTVDNTFNSGAGGQGNGWVKSVAIQEDGKVLVGGGFTNFNYSGKDVLVRLNTNGSVDNSFTLSENTVTGVLSIAIQKDGKILLGRQYAGQPKTLQRLKTDGSVDSLFKANIGLAGDGHVNVIRLQSDEKIVVGGAFGSFNGRINNRFVRLDPNGGVDSTFNTCLGANGRVEKIAVQKNGQILIGGSFNSFNGILNKGLLRLNADGTLDNGFNFIMPYNNLVQTIAVQEDGRILVAGTFPLINGSGFANLIRIHPDGSFQDTLSWGQGSSNRVYALACQSDTKIIVGGSFSEFKGIPANSLVRLNSNGSIDDGFNIGTGVNGPILSIVVQPDNKILIGGSFNSFNGSSKKNLVRLNVDGSVDNSFDIGIDMNGIISDIVLQPDGEMIVAGSFTRFNGINKNRLIRLHADGSIDNSFDIGTGANGDISSICLQSNGKIIAGGYFSEFNGVPKGSLVRLHEDGSIDNTLENGQGITGLSVIVNTVSIEPDGDILAGGYFGKVDTYAYNYIVRLYGEPVIASLHQRKEYDKDGVFAKLYPNPATYKFTVELSEENLGSGIELKLYSSTGIMQRSMSVIYSGQNIPVNGLSEGIYFFEMWKDGNCMMKGSIVLE